MYVLCTYVCGFTHAELVTVPFTLLRQFPMVLVFGCRLLSFCLPSQRIILVWQRIGLTWVSMILSSIGLVMFPESFVHLDVFSDQSICLKPSVPPSIFKPARICSLPEIFPLDAQMIMPPPCEHDMKGLTLQIALS